MLILAMGLLIMLPILLPFIIHQHRADTFVLHWSSCELPNGSGRFYDLQLLCAEKAPVAYVVEV